MLDFVASVTTESDLFNQSLHRLWDGPHDPASVSVPSCPDWSAADLAWHLTEVQYFWASIVEGSLLDPGEVTPLSRPGDDALLALNAEQAGRLVELLTNGDPAQPVWSWHEGRQDIAWVQRRQAHEVLIHRIDADLTVAAASDDARPGLHGASVDEALAADGVDEILTVMLDVGEPPSWGRFERDGATVALEVPGRRWNMALGHVDGTDGDGTEHHLPAIELVDSLDEPGAVLTTAASTLHLWLWRRAELTDANITGDASLINRLHQLAAME
jgi:hypothetical protein